jgi:DNA-directed RNA polymerase subunit RPC12/RpoP
MECPKCGGGAFVSEEDLIKILENTDPIKAVIKIIYQCRACSEKFSRLVHDTLESRNKETTETTTSVPTQDVPDPAESLSFF